MIFFKNIKGFTLVELIVVITIVGILSTVGFISYSGYLTGARDSNRISQMVKLTDSLQIYAATKKLPFPDNYIQITASGTLIGYQGYVGVNVLETIDYTNGGKDPKDNTYYSYYLSKDRRLLQLLSFMEESESITYSSPQGVSQSYAIDYSNRYVKVHGKKLGILTQKTTNIPAQEVSGVTSVDIVTESINTYVAHISNSETFTGTGGILRSAVPNGSCKRIKQLGRGNGSGKYTINPAGNGKISVYCDMETAGGGWTYVARGNGGNTNTSFSGVQLNADIDCSEAGGCAGGGIGWHLSADIINDLAYKDNSGYYETFITNSKGADINGASFPVKKEYRFRKEKQDFTFESVMSDFFEWNGDSWIDNNNASSGGANDRGPAWVPGSANYCCDSNKNNCAEASMNLEGQFSHTNNNQHLRCSVSDAGQNSLIIFVR